MKVKLLSRIRLLATPWTAAYQAPPSTGFSRQEYWSGVPLPSPIYITLWTIAHKAPVSTEILQARMLEGLPRPPPGDLPDRGIKPESLTSLALAGGFSTLCATWEALKAGTAVQNDPFT